MARDLVLLHGAGSGPEIWSSLARRLAPLRVDAPALPGHRDPGPGRDSIAGYAEWVAERLDGRPPVVLGGSSMGGAIALFIALERPALLAGLVLIGTGGRLRVHPRIFELLEGDPAEAYRELAAWHMPEGADPRSVEKSAELLALVPPAVTAGDFRACDAFDVLDRLGEIALPALVIVGERDRLTPPRYAERLAEAIPGASLVVVPRAGHLPMVERPRPVAEAVAAFLAHL